MCVCLYVHRERSGKQNASGFDRVIPRQKYSDSEDADVRVAMCFVSSPPIGSRTRLHCSAFAILCGA